MDERDSYIFCSEVSKVAGAAADKVVKLASHLSPAEAAPNYNEGQTPAPAVRVGTNFRLLHLFHDLGAQCRGVTDGFEWKRVVGHAGHDVQVGDIAASDNEMVKTHPGAPAVVGLIGDFVSCEVNGLHGLGAAEHMRQ